MDIAEHYKSAEVDAKEFQGRDRLTKPYDDFADQWRNSGATTEEDFINFYKNSNYIDELAEWHANDKIFSARKVAKLLQLYVPAGSKILDFGAGIGSDSLAWDALGYDVSYYEINEGCKAFMRYRLQKRNHTRVKVIEDPKANAPYEAVLMFDVIGHFKNPFTELEKIGKLANCLIFTVDIGVHDDRKGGHPQHQDFPRSMIWKCLSNLGYEKVKVEGVAFPPQVWKRK